MTTEERNYKEEVAVLNMLVGSMSEIDEDTDIVIDRLFDMIKLNGDFESRTCENCEYFNRIGVCDNEDSVIFDKLTWDTFGCNKWEAKENK